jgi:hypothetical protein
LFVGEIEIHGGVPVGSEKISRRPCERGDPQPPADVL